MSARSPDPVSFVGVGLVRRRFVWSVLVAGIVAAAFAPDAVAQNYPWCSNFADGAGINCGFATEAQCKAEILGSGGFCTQNNLYRPAVAAAPAGNASHRRKRR